MSDSASFGDWIRRRRRALDLTREALAQQVGCAVVTIRKIETDERRPSRQIAERLAECLQIPLAERAAFLQAARAELAVDRLATSIAPAGRAVSTTTAHMTLAEQRPLPSGTITFLFTDIEGSTQLWEQQPMAMQAALTRHDTTLREFIPAHGGVIFKTVGDGVHAAFTRAPDALAAAIAAQRALHREVWGATGPLRVRMALHTGAAEERDNDYFGPPLNRVARLMATGHGSQILLTRATQELVRDDLPHDVELRDLGMHRLKDLTRPEQIFQVVTPDLLSEFPLLNSLDARPHNLPVQLTSLVGREVEVAQVCDLLRRLQVRLVTLTGPGGVGKTRLALQAAVELLDDFADGVWFVNLAPITEPTFAANIIAQTLGVRESSGQTLINTLKAYLRTKQVLLLVDNFEHIMEAAPLIAELLATAPSLKVLVTSRMPLHFSGEREFAVPPLALPDRTQPVELERLTQYEAVRLFIERAQAVKTNFVVTNKNAPAVAEICSRLDGLPLAIELAAARAKLFAPEALLVRLSRSLKFLTAGARDLPVRQQTLRNTIDWSYQLLHPEEQILLTRLSVFVGGCTLEAVEAVCNVDGDLPVDVVDGMAALVDKSRFLQAEDLDIEPRFTMLETIREYALEKLSKRGEFEIMHRQHAAYYLTVAETARRDFSSGAAQVAWMERLEREHDNMLTALAWYQESADSVEDSIRLAAALSQFWILRGYFSEGLTWLTRTLAQPAAVEGTAVRAKGLRSAASITYHQGDYVAARRFNEESLKVSQAIGDTRNVAEALEGLGLLAFTEGDFQRARAIFNECITLYQSLGDQDGIHRSLATIGQIAAYEGNYDEATTIIQQALARARQQGNALLTANHLLDIGWIAYRQGDYTGAEALYVESLDLYRQLGDQDGIALVLNNLGDVAYRQGNDAQAAAHFSESLVLHKQFGDQEGITGCIVGLAQLAQRRGDYTQAAIRFAEGLAFYRQFGNQEDIAICLMGLSEAIGKQGQWLRAARLLGTVEVILEAISAGVVVSVRYDFDRIVSDIGAQLDEATFTASWTEGRAMSIEQAIADALNEGI